MVKIILGAITCVCGLAMGGAAADAAVADVPGNKSTKAVLPTGSEGVTGDLFGVGDSDWYRVTLDRGYNYGVEVDAYCPRSLVRLLDRDARELARAGSTYDFPAFITRHTTYGGLYYVEVRSTGLSGDCDPSTGSTYRGDFRLAAFRECGADARTRCRLPIGDDVESVVSVYNDRDWFRVDVPRDGTYTFTVVNPRGGEFSFSPNLSLRRADTSIVSDSTRDEAYQCEPSGDTGACLSGPLKAGRHYLVVRFADTEGSQTYRLGARVGE